MVRITGPTRTTGQATPVTPEPGTLVAAKVAAPIARIAIGQLGRLFEPDEFDRIHQHLREAIESQIPQLAGPVRPVTIPRGAIAQSGHRIARRFKHALKRRPKELQPYYDAAKAVTDDLTAGFRADAIKDARDRAWEEAKSHTQNQIERQYAGIVGAEPQARKWRDDLREYLEISARERPDKKNPESWSTVLADRDRSIWAKEVARRWATSWACDPVLADTVRRLDAGVDQDIAFDELEASRMVAVRLRALTVAVYVVGTAGTVVGGLAAFGH